MKGSIERMIKTNREIKTLKKSASIANSCIPVIENALKENEITEKEIARRIRRKIYSQGATLAFRILVASGKRSAIVHPKPSATDKKIDGTGYVDFGASYKNYKSDITVPFVVGKIGKREMKMVNAVVAAHNLAMRSIKIGMPCWKLHEKVNTFLRMKGFRMIHAMGHGLGKNVHELPYIGKPRKKLRGLKKRRWERLKKIVFQENMVFTVEPAVYLKNVGGCRLENVVLITKREPGILTHARLIKA